MPIQRRFAPLAAIPYVLPERLSARERLMERIHRGTQSPALQGDDVSRSTHFLDILISELDKLDQASAKTSEISDVALDAIYAAILFGLNAEDPMDLALRLIDGDTPEVLVRRMKRKRARDNGTLSGARRRNDAKNRWEDAALELAKTLGPTATVKMIFDRLFEDGVDFPWSMLERRISEWRNDGTLPRPDRKKAK